MIFKCIQCERDITALRFHSAIAVMSGKYHIPAVRVTWSARTAASIFRQTCLSWNSPALTGGRAMITPQEARQRTRALVEHYVNECECRDLTDVKHVLTALISMATQAIVATNGKAAALQVLVNTLTHTAENEVPYRMETTAEGGLHITVSRKH